MKRRTFLQGTLAVSATGLVAQAGLFLPQVALAAGESGAFEAKTLADALKAMGANAEESKDILLNAPEIAENGAVVPVEVSTTIANASEISLLVEGNPFPLAATFVFGEGAIAAASTRLKMDKTGNIIALVKAGAKTYSAKRAVQVTVGGCDGA